MNTYKLVSFSESEIEKYFNKVHGDVTVTKNFTVAIEYEGIELAWAKYDLLFNLGLSSELVNKVSSITLGCRVSYTITREILMSIIEREHAVNLSPDNVVFTNYNDGHYYVGLKE